MAGEQAKRAKDDAAAFADLKAKLDEAKGALKGLQDEAQKDLFARSPIAKAKHDVDQLAQSMHDLQKAKADAYGAGAAGIGEKGSASSEALAKNMKDAEGSATAIDAALGAGGKALSWAAGEIRAAASYAWDKAKEGLEYGIKASAARAKQKDIFDALTKSHGGTAQGEIALQVRAQLAGETAQDPATVGAQMRRLIAAHFNRGETEALIKVAADIGEVKEGGGDAFLSALEKLEHRGKATERDLRAMAGAGLDLQRVLAELKGSPTESIDAVEARLKKGQVSANAFVGAAVKIAKQDFGGLAGKGLDASLNRAQLGLKGLFSGWDISPLEEFANKVSEVLSSKEGGDLKKSLADAAGVVIGLVKNISRDDIRAGLSAASDTAYQLAEGLKIARDAAQDLVKTGKELGLIDETANRVARKHDIDTGEKTIERYVRPEDEAAEAKAKAEKDGQGTGKAFDDGLAAGLEANAGKPAAAATAAAAGVDKAAKDKLGVKSPSRVAAETGKFFDEGMEQGIDRHAGRPESAAARLAGRVSRAGVPMPWSVSGGASAGAGGASSVVVQWSPTYQIALGSPAELANALREHDAAAYPRLLAMWRQAERDARETGGPVG